MPFNLLSILFTSNHLEILTENTCACGELDPVTAGVTLALTSRVLALSRYTGKDDLVSSLDGWRVFVAKSVMTRII